MVMHTSVCEELELEVWLAGGVVMIVVLAVVLVVGRRPPQLDGEMALEARVWPGLERLGRHADCVVVFVLAEACKAGAMQQDAIDEQGACTTGAGTCPQPWQPGAEPDQGCGAAVRGALQAVEVVLQAFARRADGDHGGGEGREVGDRAYETRGRAPREG